MVVRYETDGHDRHSRTKQTNIKADIIVLGCTLPGIVTAHKLKQKLGKSVNIVVLDLNTSARRGRLSKLNVSFQQNDEVDDETRQVLERTIHDNVARHYMVQFARDFKIPLPDAIIAPEKVRSPLNKLFQHIDGKIVTGSNNYHDFEYLSYLERYELVKYQDEMDQSMQNLFHTSKNSLEDRQLLLYFDQTTMETHLSRFLACTSSRDIMRVIVNLVCGSSAENVSVLFYLHQCYRSSSSRNHIDGDNTRFREKLVGYCRKQFTHKLQQSIADITLIAKPIKEIRTYSGERVILETMRGETNYVCSILAMALRPEQLTTIRFEHQLLSESDATAAKAMTPGIAKKFLIQYEDNFWQQNGYSGDILSIKGPIIWAMERPESSATGSKEKYAALIGYLKVDAGNHIDSREEVVDQLVQLFGEEAANPVTYRESNIIAGYIPRNGDYVGLRKLMEDENNKYIFWGAFDVFADGDVGAALEAGHTAYLRLINILRPQAQTYDDMVAMEQPTLLPQDPIVTFLDNFYTESFVKIAVTGCSILAGIYFIRSMIMRR